MEEIIIEIIVVPVLAAAIEFAVVRLMEWMTGTDSRTLSFAA
jgi:hypothetical protein